MNKLKLDLVIDHEIESPRHPILAIQTGIRVFDKKSHHAADLAIRSGALGRHSKSAYYLVGLYLDEAAGAWKRVIFPMYRKSTGQRQENILDVPAILTDIL
jgi:hypothetical protein